MTGDLMGRRWTRSASTARCWYRRSQCTATTPATSSRSWQKHPDRFCLVKPVDPNDPAIAGNIADWKAKKGTVGVRILMRDEVSADPADPGLNRVLTAAAKHSLAVNLLCTRRLEQAGQLAARTRIIIDHLGLQQPLERPAPAQPWADLPKVLALATYPNVAIKITGTGARAVPVPRHLGPAQPHLRRR
jgi:predicted TIM-barrel fold metal-dependent hydrolase